MWKVRKNKVSIKGHEMISSYSGSPYYLNCTIFFESQIDLSFRQRPKNQLQHPHNSSFIPFADVAILQLFDQLKFTPIQKKKKKTFNMHNKRPDNISFNLVFFWANFPFVYFNWLVFLILNCISNSYYIVFILGVR